MWRLAEYSDLLQRGDKHSVRVTDHIETPYDEYGVIDRRELFHRILGSVASEYHWQGSFAGPHHLMWPRHDYNIPGATEIDTQITSTFRSSATLRVILPRELHDYLHRVTTPPAMPGEDVMRQYNVEQDQITHLYDTIRYGSYATLPLDDQQKETLRHERFLKKLDTMQDAQVGLMPDREALAAMTLPEARHVLRHLAMPLGISARHACSETFFADWNRFPDTTDNCEET